MKQPYILLAFAGVVFFCSCDPQTKINTAKIETLSQQLARLQQNQEQQFTLLQTQLTALGPALDKINNSYFEKSHEDAFFFHTNTLYLLLTVDQKIEAELQAAATERQADSSLAYYYHTNQTDTMYFCVAQIESAMAGQESRITDKFNTESMALSNALAGQIKLLAPDEAELARRETMAADLKQIQSDLAAIKARLLLTNLPSAQP